MHGQGVCQSRCPIYGMRLLAMEETLQPKRVTEMNISMPYECGLCKSRGYEKTIVRVTGTGNYGITIKDGMISFLLKDQELINSAELGDWIKCRCGRCGNDMMHYTANDARITKPGIKKGKTKMGIRGKKLPSRIALECQECRSRSRFVLLFDASYHVMVEDGVTMTHLIENGKDLTSQDVENRLKMFLAGDDLTPGIICKNCGESDVNIITLDEVEINNSEVMFDQHFMERY